MPAGPADVASQIRAVAARIRPAIRMGSAELRDAHTTRIPAADGILREELLRHRPPRLGRPRLPHPLVGLIPRYLEERPSRGRGRGRQRRTGFSDLDFLTGLKPRDSCCRSDVP